MKLCCVNNKKTLRQFLKTTEIIYKNDPLYVPQMRLDLKKTLYNLIIKQKQYKALIVMDGKRPVARVAWTTHEHKQFPEKGLCGFFSHFECVDSQEVAQLLLTEVVKDLQSCGITYLEGTYFPFDQDNRRGILMQGFETSPMILTSYNPPYYAELLSRFGMRKAFDAVAYRMVPETLPVERYCRISNMAKKRYDYRVEDADFNDMDRLLSEVSKVMKAATTDEVYQDAPTPEVLASIVRQWKNFLQQRYIKIARSNKDNQMLGVVVAIPDFNQVFKKMNGSLNPISLIKMLYWKKRITYIRGMLQFVLPKYQGLGVNLALYLSLYDEAVKDKVTLIEAGTMMEHNAKPNSAIESAGGELYKRYRIFGLQIEDVKND